MSNIDYQSMSDKELVDRVEQGEMHTNSDLYTEFMKRMVEQGTSYENTPEDEERWQADIVLKAQKRQ